MRGLISFIVDAIIPPRRTELLVRALMQEHLARLGGAEGLPYHDARVQALVWELKYRRSGRAAALAGAHIGERLLATAAEELGTPLLIPIPMHPKRKAERGYNQTELLCRAALPHLQDAVVYAPAVLRRVAHTPHQQGLPKAERLRNVQHSMEVAAPHQVAGRVCIVVDDVATTGATLAEAARALRLAGAARVHTLALARS